MNRLVFANPWMLAALVAVGLPVLIHYLTRARPRRIAFPPCQFLQEACAGQQAVHRLRTWILLAVRTLAVLAIVALFARPFLKPTGAGGRQEAARRVVLILDSSLSMRAVQRGVPLFARAEAEAADVLRSLEAGSEAAVILAGATPRPLLPALSGNLPALHDALVKGEPTFEMGDPGAAVALAQRLLGGAGTIYVFSDFQQSNWDAGAVWKELPAGIRCHLRPVSSSLIDNVAITAARVAPAEPVVGEPAEVIATVFNATSRPRQENVRLEMMDFVQEQRVTVPAFSSGDAIFNISFPRTGAVAGKVSTQPDDLREDNTRFLGVRVQQALQVLLISDADPADQGAAAFFVSRALAPSPQATPGFTLTRRHSQDADRGVLETAGAFVLAAPATLTGEAAEIIERRVNEGAYFVALLDGPTAPLLMPASFKPPFRLQRTVSSPEGESVAPGARSLFSEGDASDWSAVRFYRRYQTQLLEGRDREVLLRYRDGSAALSISPAGKGAAVFVNLPMTPESGDLVGSPLMPAMLHEILRVIRRGSDERAVTPGTPWTIDAAARSADGLSVSAPDGQRIQAEVVASGRMTRLALPAARQPGLYRVEQGGTAIAAGVVNIDPRESDLRPAALDRIKPASGATVSIMHDEGELLTLGKTRPLGPFLAAAFAILLAIEMLMLALWRRNSAPAGGGGVRTLP